MREVIGIMSLNGRELPLARANRVGNLVFVSGQLPFGPDGTIVGSTIMEQTQQALTNLAAVLADAGATLSQVAKVTVWLTDASDFQGFNEVYARFFPTRPPARSTVISALAVDALIEIEAIACVGA
jgi:reactive intermediate/imine deaminase